MSESDRRPLTTSSSRRAFTLIEMLTVVALLIVVLGLMVSLARYVRDQSAQVLTRDLLKQLDQLMAQYIEHNGGRVPVVEAVPPKKMADAMENIAFLQAARRNNEQYIRALKADYRSHRGADLTLPVDPFDQQPISVYDLRTMRDAWGTPIVFMPGQHPQIGMAPSHGGQDQSFFFSAGPDRKYLTRDDNIYSYEAPGK